MVRAATPQRGGQSSAKRAKKQSSARPAKKQQQQQKRPVKQQIADNSSSEEKETSDEEAEEGSDEEEEEEKPELSDDDEEQVVDKADAIKDDLWGDGDGDDEETNIERRARQGKMMEQHDEDDSESEEEDEEEVADDDDDADEKESIEEGSDGDDLEDDDEVHEGVRSAFDMPGEDDELETQEEVGGRIKEVVTMLADWRTSSQNTTKSRSDVIEQLTSDCAKYYQYLPELIELFLSIFSPAELVEFLEANEKPRPMVIRTNTLKARRRDLAEALASRGVNLQPLAPWTKVGIKILESEVPIGATPEYLAGHYMLQSAASFAPCIALAPQPGEKVLDMASAPGGKTSYIAQLMRNTGMIIANDLKKERLQATVANLSRLGVRNTICCCHNGKSFPKVVGGFDRVLLDAPCSGLGVISRDPSVKLQRTVHDLKSTAHLQRELLLAAIDSVDHKSATGGIIVYSTCSVAAEENEQVVQYALDKRDVVLVDSGIEFAKPGLTRYRQYRFHPSMKLTRRLYPHVHNMDGFFVAKFKKRSNKIPGTDKEVEVKEEGDDESSEDDNDDSMSIDDEETHISAKKQKVAAAALKKIQKKSKKETPPAAMSSEEDDSEEDEEQEKEQVAPVVKKNKVVVSKKKNKAAAAIVAKMKKSGVQDMEVDEEEAAAPAPVSAKKSSKKKGKVAAPETPAPAAVVEKKTTTAKKSTKKSAKRQAEAVVEEDVETETAPIAPKSTKKKSKKAKVQEEVVEEAAPAVVATPTSKKSTGKSKKSTVKKSSKKK